MVNRDFEYYMENLSDEEFFSRFTEEEMMEIKSRSTIHQFGKGQVLFFQEDYKNYCYYLLKGLIRLEKTDETGDFQYIDYVTGHSFLPYGEFLNPDNMNNYTGFAATEIILLMIPRDLLEKITMANNEQMIYMYQMIAEVLVFTERRIQMTTISSAKQRVIQTLAIWMYDLGHRMGERIVINYPLTIGELATVSGTTRETAGRVVKALTEEGLIEFTRQEIIYLDLDYFNELLW
ncbi:cyclic nucleotide-binding protein [Aerococcus sp. HMSC23C02]|uniref:Cyclic nucleotide-binding protein n=2 Tax=Aerococcus sanguinicola TaxID=119206 RepID=A0A120I8Z4_9LACT|nr:cyclic nucleotide-binding protein [Aerococcus sanguinicola]OFT95941.1 cyclic nucleotide-binding protein [Aerococcus sp. HMSC23C02]